MRVWTHLDPKTESKNSMKFSCFLVYFIVERLQNVQIWWLFNNKTNNKTCKFNLFLQYNVWVQNVFISLFFKILTCTKSIFLQASTNFYLFLSTFIPLLPASSNFYYLLLILATSHQFLSFFLSVKKWLIFFIFWHTLISPTYWS